MTSSTNDVRPVRAWVVTSRRIGYVGMAGPIVFDAWVLPTPEHMDGRAHRYQAFPNIIAAFHHALEQHPIENEKLDGFTVQYSNGAELQLSPAEADIPIDSKLTQWSVLFSGIHPAPEGRRIDPVTRPDLDILEDVMSKVSSLWGDGDALQTR